MVSVTVHLDTHINQLADNHVSTSLYNPQITATFGAGLEESVQYAIYLPTSVDCSSEVHEVDEECTPDVVSCSLYSGFRLMWTQWASAFCPH